MGQRRALRVASRDTASATLSAAKPGRPSGVLGVLGHVCVVSLIWKAHLTGQEHGFKARAFEHSPVLAELQNRQSQVDRWYVEFAASQSAESLTKDIRFTFVDGGPGVMAMDEMLLHVVNHGTYHRGYVAAMLYDFGVRPPTMDLPVYVRNSRAPDGAQL